MTGNTIAVIVNSGKTSVIRKKLAETVEAAFAELDVKVAVTLLMKGQDYAAVSERLVKQAKRDNTFVVIAGGDGSVNLVANLCYKHGVTLGIIPTGTFNYFARNLNIPVDVKSAAKVIADGHTEKATLGFLNERVFLNKVSFGIWTRLIRQREEASARFGRARIVAVFAAAYSFLQLQKVFPITMECDGQKSDLKTPMVFVCNNHLQLDNLGLYGTECTKRKQLAVIAMKKANRFQVMRFMLLGLLKSLAKEERLTEFCAGDFTITTRRRAIDLVIDGEIVRVAAPLQFHAKPDALTVLCPRAREAA